jgi:hypothetical protein
MSVDISRYMKDAGEYFDTGVRMSGYDASCYFMLKSIHLQNNAIIELLKKQLELMEQQEQYRKADAKTRFEAMSEMI